MASSPRDYQVAGDISNKLDAIQIMSKHPKTLLSSNHEVNYRIAHLISVVNIGNHTLGPWIM